MVRKYIGIETAGHARGIFYDNAVAALRKSQCARLYNNNSTTVGLISSSELRHAPTVVRGKMLYCRASGVNCVRGIIEKFEITGRWLLFRFGMCKECVYVCEICGLWYRNNL